MITRAFHRLVPGLAVFCFAISALAAPIPNELQGVGITEHLGSTVSIRDLTFKDETGQSVRLADYFRPGHPVLLTLVYYECPNLCNFLLNGVVKSLRSLDWTPGKQFDIITVSINSKEGPSLAKAKKAAYLESYGRKEAASGWHFLTGDESQIRKLASEIGFGYRYDTSEKQFAHTAAIYALSPAGKITRYLYGIDFPTKDVRLALLEASNGQVGTVIDRILLFCYRYDPKSRTYSVYLTQLMKASSAGMVVVFGGYLAVFWRRQRRIGDSPHNERESFPHDV